MKKFEALGGTTLWPGAEGAQKMMARHDLDWKRFIQMFSEGVSRAIPSQ